jgi:bifunctional non-homologous end joining protein LigD
MRCRVPFAVTNPDKVFWPDEGYTKRDVIRYYERVFPKLRPWVQDRPLVLRRCPNGLRGRCFWQKEKPEGMPPGTPTVRIVHRNGIRHYVVGGRRETTLALANLGCISVHLVSGRAGAVDRPDWVCFDLDPASKRFADAARAGRRLKEALDALTLRSFAKTSGKRGLHVFVPIRVGPDVGRVRDFAERLGALLARAYPDAITTEFSLARREGRVYVDVARNGFTQAVAAPWCLRRAPRAPVSTPLDWSEVDPTLDPSELNLRTIERRLTGADPWKEFFRARQSLGDAVEAVARI